VVFVSIPVSRSFNYIVDVKFITYSLFFGKQCIFSSGSLKVLILPASAVFLCVSSDVYMLLIYYFYHLFNQCFIYLNKY
jgi:hypothetical protein